VPLSAFIVVHEPDTSLFLGSTVQRTRVSGSEGGDTRKRSRGAATLARLRRVKRASAAAEGPLQGPENDSTATNGDASPKSSPSGNEITDPHDRLLREALSSSADAAGLLRAVLPAAR
jgi:hypothetical protein